MLRNLGKVEVEDIIAEFGSVEVSCDYCNSVYSFTASDLHNIFNILDIDIESISREIH
jgi:molecular chaperone Hsp33